MAGQGGGISFPASLGRETNPEPGRNLLGDKRLRFSRCSRFRPMGRLPAEGKSTLSPCAARVNFFPSRFMAFASQVFMRWIVAFFQGSIRRERARWSDAQAVSCLLSVPQGRDRKPRGSRSVTCDSCGPLEHARNREEASYSRGIAETVLRSDTRVYFRRMGQNGLPKKTKRPPPEDVRDGPFFLPGRRGQALPVPTVTLPRWSLADLAPGCHTPKERMRLRKSFV